MQDKQKKKLDNLLSTFGNKQTEIKKQIDIREQERNKFLEQFETFCTSTIKPTMEEIGAALKAKGHDFEIIYTKENKTDKGVTVDSRIMMNILPNGKGKNSYNEKAAHIMFFADKYKNEIGLHENTISPGSGGHAGTKTNKYNFDTLTKDKIEEEIVESLDNIFNNKF